MSKSCSPIFLLCLGVLVTVNGRKFYDIEAEALRLYGEDLATVVQRFRRSPEYVKILTDKLNESMDYINMIQKQVSLACLGRIQNTTMEMYPQETPSQIGTESTTDSVSSHTETTVTDNATTEINRVKMLDDFVSSSVLSVEEVNSMKELGYKLAGEAIHKIIKSMGDSDPGSQSTRMPSGVDEVTTTEHPQVHEVTTPVTDSHTDPTDHTDTPTPPHLRSTKRHKRPLSKIRRSYNNI